MLVLMLSESDDCPSWCSSFSSICWKLTSYSSGLSEQSESCNKKSLTCLCIQTLLASFIISFELPFNVWFQEENHSHPLKVFLLTKNCQSCGLDTIFLGRCRCWPSQDIETRQARNIPVPQPMQRPPPLEQQLSIPILAAGTIVIYWNQSETKSNCTDSNRARSGVFVGLFPSANTCITQIVDTS